MGPHVNRSPGGLRSQLKISINRAALWVSARTEDPSASELDKIVAPEPALAPEVQLDDQVIWLPEASDEEVFTKKLSAFLDGEAGSSSERDWLLNG